MKSKEYLDGHDQTTLEFLKAALYFLPTALEDGADLGNAVFLFAQAGSEFVIKAGNGDWEYYFSEEYPNQITGTCVRKPWLRFFWDKVLFIVRPWLFRLKDLRALPPGDS